MNSRTWQAPTDYYAILRIACKTSRWLRSPDPRCLATSRPALCFMHDVLAPDVALYDDSTCGVPTAPGIGVAPDSAASAAPVERQEVFTEG